jgi:methyl-accepting chemotaxis protein
MSGFVAALLTAIFVVLVWFFPRQMAQISERGMVARARAVASVLAKAMEQPVLYNDRRGAAELLTTLEAQDDVVYGLVCAEGADSDVAVDPLGGEAPALRCAEGELCELASYAAADRDVPARLLGDAEPGRSRRCAREEISSITSTPAGVSGVEILHVGLRVEAEGRRGYVVVGYSTEGPRREAQENFFVVLWVALAVLVLGLALAFAFGTYLGSPLQDITRVARRIADGDIAGDVALGDRKDEIGQMADAFGTMIKGQRDVLRQVSEAAARIAAAANQIYAATQEQQAAGAQQSAAVQEVGQTMQSLLASASHIADSAQGVLGNAEKTRETTDATARRITELSGHAGRIQEILEVIRDIADRSDLLALNASLEATRAGEAGRSFSLVATEMRRLAERVTASVEDVKSLVADVRGSGASTVVATEENRKLAEGTTESARQITMVTQQQRSATEQVSQSMRDFSNVIAHSVAATHQLRESAETLKAEAERLASVVARFRVDDAKEP